jgi:hypothetical protein
MHGTPDTHPDVSFHGEVWTDTRGQATVSLPRDAYGPEAELEYALHPIDGETGVRLTAGLREGRFTFATDEPHVKVAWRISRRGRKAR